MIDEKQLQEWRKLADEAHEGPWMWQQCYELGRRVHWAIENPKSKAEGKIINHHLILEYSHHKDGLTGQVVSDDPDLAFIAAARSAVPALLEEVARLNARVAELEAMTAKDDSDNEYDAIDAFNNHDREYFMLQTHITDGFNNWWPKNCPRCNAPMKIERPGYARCSKGCEFD